MARPTDQVVEVIPLMDGEDSPRRVLCPWRVHPPASTLPAVARATAGRFVRCEWLVGRGVGVLRGSASGFCVTYTREEGRGFIASSKNEHPRWAFKNSSAWPFTCHIIGCMVAFVGVIVAR